MAGYWALKAERQGLIGMSFTNSSPIMVPTRSKEVGPKTLCVKILFCAYSSLVKNLLGTRPKKASKKAITSDSDDLLGAVERA